MVLRVKTLVYNKKESFGAMILVKSQKHFCVFTKEVSLVFTMVIHLGSPLT